MGDLNKQNFKQEFVDKDMITDLQSTKSNQG